MKMILPTIFEVTAEDIMGGRVCEPTMCPIARCLERTTLPRWHVMSVLASCVHASEFTIARLGLPPEVTAFIVAFDKGGSYPTLQPFKFIPAIEYLDKEYFK